MGTEVPWWSIAVPERYRRIGVGDQSLGDEGQAQGADGIFNICDAEVEAATRWIATRHDWYASFQSTWTQGRQFPGTKAQGCCAVWLMLCYRTQHIRSREQFPETGMTPVLWTCYIGSIE